MGAGVSPFRTGSHRRARFGPLKRLVLVLVVLAFLAGLSACAVTPSVTAFVERTDVPGAASTYVGRVSPAPVGTRVVVQRNLGGVWTDVASAAVAADGSYAMPLPSVGPATYFQRVVSRNAGGEQQAVSRVSFFGAAPPAVFPAAIASWLAGRSGFTSVAIYDAATGQTAYWGTNGGTNRPYYSASIAKVSILGTVLRQAAVAGRPLSSDERAHAVPMITQSSNDDATWLWNHVGGAPAVAAFQRSAGLTGTVQDTAGHWGLATTTAADQARVVQAIEYPNPLLRPADQAYARSLMRSVEPSQHWGVSAGAPSGATVELKNGWLPHAGYYRVNSIGRVYDAGHDYVIAVLTATPGTEYSSFTYGIATIEGVTRMLWQNPPSGGAAVRVAPDASDAGR